MKNLMLITSKIFALALFVSLVACGAATPKGKGFSGTVKGAENMQILMEQFQFDGKHVAIGKATADASGAFNFPTEKAFEKGIYKVQIGAKQIYFILDGTEEQVSMKADLNTIQKLDIQVEGSKAMSCYLDQVKSLQALPQGGFTPELAKEKIASACNPLMGAFMTSQFFGQNAGSFIPEFKNAAEKLLEYMPGSKYATDYANILTSLNNQLLQQEAGSSIKVGQPAPEINFPDPSGKKRSLAALKGNVVLLDFWASWCGPCRRENPHVVEVYKKYKSKGFTVFSVSLDKETGKDAWIQAIAQDGLIWENHVSDLKFWKSEAAALYGVQSIPQTFLLDREGKIAAINPRNNLEEAVKKALGN